MEPMGESSMMTDVRWGIRMGLAVAVTFSVLAILRSLVIIAMEPSVVFFLLRVLVTYVCCGVAGGAAAGVMRPLGASFLGSGLVGLVVGSIVFFGILTCLYGSFSTWDGETRSTLVWCGSVGGPISGMFFWLCDRFQALKEDWRRRELI